MFDCLIFDEHDGIFDCLIFDEHDGVFDCLISDEHDGIFFSWRTIYIWSNNVLNVNYKLIITTPT